MLSKLRFGLLLAWLLLLASGHFWGIDTILPTWAASVSAPHNQTVPFDFGLHLPQVASPRLINLTNHPSMDRTPSWSFDGGHVAFLRGQGDKNEIYRIDADGGNPLLLASNPSEAGSIANHAVWSPDGSQIAYMQYEQGITYLNLINADGSEKRRLVGKPNATDLAWAPDGSRIAFGSNGAIYVIDPDGSDLTMLLGEEAAHYLPTWSPDSSQIAYIGGSQAGIWIMDVESREARLLANSSSVAIYTSTFAWSPNGEKIAFVYQVTPDHLTGLDIGVVDVDSGELTRVTDHFAEEHDLTWSPDSSKIAFARSADIHMVNADGSGHVILTQGFGEESVPTWSPDGSRIAFVSNKDNRHEVYAIGVNGGTPTRLTFNFDTEQSISWSPNGNYILIRVYLSFYHDLHVVGAGGDASTTLGPNLHVESFAWSPTGPQIAFTAGQTPELMGLYKYDASNSNLVKLSAELPVVNLAWSPDGQQLAFTTKEAPTSSQLYSINVDGSNLTKLSTELFVANYVWSPDGQKLAFIDSESAALYVVEATGDHLANLMTVSYANLPFPEPAWSPDGNRIAVLNSDMFGDIFVVDIEGGNQTNLSSGIGGRGHPIWSPDGGLVAFFGSSNDLYVVNPNSGTPLRLTDDMAEDSHGLAWSLDGTKIAYVQVQIEGECYYHPTHGCIIVPVYYPSTSLVSVDGSVHQTLSNNSTAPQWSPDGRYLLFQSNSGSLALVDADGNNRSELSVWSGGSWSWAPDGHRILLSMFHDIYILRIPNRQ